MKTPLHKYILLQKLQEEDWSQAKKDFYRTRTDLYADVLLIDKEFRDIMNE